MKKNFILIAIVGAIVLSLALSLAFDISASKAWNASGLTTLSVLGEEDSFRNYDFISQSDSSSNCDWPVTMLFWNNAEIDNVKFAFQNLVGGWGGIGGSMYARLDDGAGWVWDSDKGIKTFGLTTCHMRLYADSDDQMYNDSWGYYILGTTHYDKNNDTYCGWSEDAESEVCDDAATVYGWSVVEDWASFYNYESEREDSDGQGNTHHWKNNGDASAVYVP